MTIVCRSSAEFDIFRLEKEGLRVKDEKRTPDAKKEVRFFLDKVNERNAGRYHCLYQLGNAWSDRSKNLELEVTSEDTTQAPDPDSEEPSDTPGLKTDHVYVLIGVSVVVILCFFWLLFCLYKHHLKRQGLLSSKGQQQRPEERPIPAANGMDRRPDITKADTLPEDRGTETSTPAERDPQEVTYAQLDHRALTQQTVRAVSPPITETVAESSTYAAIIRR